VTGSIALYLISTLNKAVDTSHRLMEEAVVMQKRTATLFAELQHRVANNLAFLTAVLDRQARKLGHNGPVPVALEGIKDRLMAMSHSHRRLYDPKLIDQPIGQYLREVCSEQIAMFGLPITHTIDCDDIVLDLNHAVSVAMIVSELVTNSVKHGFKGRSDGHIAISFRRSPSLNEYVLIVSDDGCGISGTPDGKGGLGKTIINSLAAQLHAQITRENGSGTTVIARFSIPEQQPYRSLTSASAARPRSAEKVMHSAGAADNGASLADLLEVLVHTPIEQVGGKARAAFYLADKDGRALHHIIGMTQAYARHVDGFAISPQSLACGLAAATGHAVITPDVMAEPRWKPWVWLAEQFDYRACWSFPIETPEGKIAGTFAMYYREPTEATPRELDLASALTRTAAKIISRN
jgi:two-component sensor histidine kinase